MQTFKHLKSIFSILFIFISSFVSANDQQDTLMNQYSKAETAKAYDFGLKNEFNITYIEDQQSAKLLATKIAEYLETEGIASVVSTTAHETRNIIINNTELIEGYGRGDDAYRVKVTKNAIIVEFTSAKTLPWAFDALKELYNTDKSMKTKIFKSKSKYFKAAIISSNTGKSNADGSLVVKLSENVYSEEFLTQQLNEAILAGVSKVYLELLTSEDCKINCKTFSIFNPNAQYASGDALSIDSFNKIYKQAEAMGIEIIPVLDFSTKSNEKLSKFTGHEVFTVEMMRFYRALLIEICETTQAPTICLGKKIDDELTQIKYIEPLISIINKYNKRAIAW